MSENINKELELLRKQNEILKEGLEFYMRGNHYVTEGYPSLETIAVDYGDFAKEKMIEYDNLSEEL